MDSLFRFYKNDNDGTEALKSPFIYLFSAKKWEVDGEFDFTIDIGSDEDYKLWLKEKLDNGFKLQKGEDGYEKFRDQRMALLQKHGAPNLFGTAQEYDYLLNKLFEEAKSVAGIEERKDAIKNNFFDHTGISCFTSDEKLLEDTLHWDRFSNHGDGFCIEYDKKALSDYFFKNDIKIAGESVKYYDTDRPVLKSRYKDLKEVEKTYRKIFFSLHQSLDDEKEFRLATLFRESYPLNDSRRKQTIPKEAILSVTLGSNMGDTEKKDLIKWLQTSLPHVKIYKMEEQHGALLRLPL